MTQNHLEIDYVSGIIAWAKKKNAIISRNACDEKNLHPGGRKFIF